MTQTTRYIEWRATKKLELQVAEIMQHFEKRHELGSAVILTDNPTATFKLAEKYWQRLTRQAQKHREAKSSAEDILEITRTISRMQRVTFSAKDPSLEPDAKLYVLSPDAFATLPAHCFTFYCLTALPELPVLKLLAVDALIVSFGEKTERSGVHNKTVLEERVLTEEAALAKWLSSHSIELSQLPDDIEKANEALDILLSSNNLQVDFLHRTKLYLHTVQLAQPMQLSLAQQTRLKSLQQLEHHVRVLSPAFLSDHILDSQSDDSFLLRDLSEKKLLTLDALKSFIATQYKLGRTHLASALERHAGFIQL